MDDMFESRQVSPNIGHNSGAAAPTGLEAIVEQMSDLAHNVPTWQRARHKALVERIDALLAAAERAPKTVTTEEDSQKLSDFRKQLISAQKAADAVRLEDRKLMNTLGDTVHAFWTRRTGRIDEALVPVTKAIKGYMDKLEADAKKAQEKELQKQQAAADKAIAKGKEPPPVVAPVEPVKVTVTGDYGATTGLRKFWDFKDVNRAEIDLEALRPYLTQDAIESALRQYIKAGSRTIKGAVIFENSRVTTR